MIYKYTVYLFDGVGLRDIAKLSYKQWQDYFCDFYWDLGYFSCPIGGNIYLFSRSKPNEDFSKCTLQENII